jgi:hypothetical protein
MFIPLTSSGVIVAAASSSPDLFSSPLLLLVLGDIIGTFTSLLAVHITNKQQLKRDELAHKRQLDREQEAHRRALKDAQIERLRSPYRVLLNTADKYQVEAQQHHHLANYANVPVTGVDEAVNEIVLEGVGADVLSIFFEIRGAFNTFTAKLNTSGEGSWEEVMHHKDELIEKVEDLKTIMSRNLKGLEN